MLDKHSNAAPDILQSIAPLPALVMLRFLRAVYALDERDGQRVDTTDESSWIVLCDHVVENDPTLVGLDPIAMRDVYNRLLIGYPHLYNRTKATPTRALFRHLLFELFSRGNADSRMRFINLGYDGADALELAPEDRPNRYSIQLYDQLFRGAFDPAKVAGKDVVEISCGRGGGCDFIARYLAPCSVIGIDLARSSIEFCRRIYDVPRMSFRVGGATALPLDNECCDLVVNLEASHCYPSMLEFLAEVKRILRPGGHFLFADIRHRDKLTHGWESVASLDRQLAASGLEILSRRDLTDEVLRALEGHGQEFMDRWDRTSTADEKLGADAAAIAYCRDLFRHALTVTWRARLGERSYIYMNYVLCKPSRDESREGRKQLPRSLVVTAAPRLETAGRTPTYPHVVSLDSWIDTSVLPELDVSMVQALTAFHANPEWRSQLRVDHKPTLVHRLHLSRRTSRDNGPVGPSIFHDFCNPELWKPRRARRREFALLMDFIHTLPFTRTARILIVYSFQGHGTPLHGDHPHEDLHQEFIWFRTNKNKRFYVCNPHGEVTDKSYVESYAAWFDTCSHYQRHASDDVDGLCFSVRVDGVFTAELRQMIREVTAQTRGTMSLR